MTFTDWRWDTDWVIPTGFVPLRTIRAGEALREAWGKFIDSSSRPDDTTSIAAFLAGRGNTATTAFVGEDGVTLTTVQR